jgi:hypothetical protein
VIVVQLGTKTQYIFNAARTLMTWGLRQLGANVAEADLTEEHGLTAMLEDEPTAMSGAGDGEAVVVP